MKEECSTNRAKRTGRIHAMVKSTQDVCLGKWATPAYDTVDPRNAGHKAKTQSSHPEFTCVF